MTPKTNWPSFCLTVNLSHALDGLFSALSRLHGCKQMCFMLNEGLLNVTTFRYCCLGFLSLAWNPLGTYLFSDMTATFHVLVNTYFLNFRLALFIVLRALVRLIYLVVFNNFLNFSFFNFEQ